MSSNQNNYIPKELDNAINALGDTCVLCILCNLSSQGLRFNELQRAMHNINPVTLTNRLKKLEKEGIIIRTEETFNKVSVVYELTDKGRAILPILEEIEKFGKKFYKKN